MPAGVAYLGKLIVDAVVAAIDANRAGAAPDYARVLLLVALEGLLVAALAGVQRGIDFCQSLLRVLLSQRVHLLILDKALTLTLAQFEDSELYDKLNRARQEASIRPLSLVNRTFALAQNAVSLASYAGLLLAFSPWAVAILVVAGLPAFIAETTLLRRALPRVPVAQPRPPHAAVSRDRARARGPRERGQAVRPRARGCSRASARSSGASTTRRGGSRSAATAGASCSGSSRSAAFYGAYAWIALATIDGAISLGEMTMYLLLFKQGQSAVAAMLSAIGGMYEDNLYLSNLYDYLEQPSRGAHGTATSGHRPERRASSSTT